MGVFPTWNTEKNLSDCTSSTRSVCSQEVWADRVVFSLETVKGERRLIVCTSSSSSSSFSGVSAIFGFEDGF